MDYEILVREHIEELIAAGIGTMISRANLTTLITNLVLNCYSESRRDAMREDVKRIVQMQLLTVC
jgi:hypothetical protein